MRNKNLHANVSQSFTDADPDWFSSITTCPLHQLRLYTNSVKSSISAFCTPFASTVENNKVIINITNTMKDCILRITNLDLRRLNTNFSPTKYLKVLTVRNFNSGFGVWGLGFGVWGL